MSASWKLWALVPVKPFAEAKQRLAPVLDDPARAEFSRLMLERTLAILGRVRAIARVAVVSRDPRALALARDNGAQAILETGLDLNAALAQGTGVAVGQGAEAVLVLPTDLPHLTEADIAGLIERGRPAPSVVLAVAHRHQGTNALLLNPPDVIEFDFGQASAPRHIQAARRAGARIEQVDSPGLTFDVDLPEDWERIAREFSPILSRS